MVLMQTYLCVYITALSLLLQATIASDTVDHAPDTGADAGVRTDSKEPMAQCPPSRILMVPFGGSSHVTLHGILGNELRKRGHTVAIATDGGSEFVVGKVKQTGLPFFDIGNFTFAMISDPMLEDASTQDENFGQALWAYWNVTYKQGLTKLRPVIAQFKPDYMIIDNYRAEALDAAQEASVRYAVTFNMFGYLGLESASYAPAAPMPFSIHDTGFVSRFVQRVVAPIIFHLQVLPTMRDLNIYRKEMGVASVWDVREQLWGHVTIYKGFFGFEYPIPLSPSAILAGMPLHPKKRPLSEYDRELARWINEGGEAEFVVYAALGSAVYVKAEEFLIVVEAVSLVKNARLLFSIRKPLQAHMGEKTLELARSFFSSRPNALRIEQWVNQEAILCNKKVWVFVSHSGKQSLAEAMNCGKPVLGYPFIVDQPANALRVQDAGMGLYVNRLTATPSEIAEKIKQLAYNEKFAQASRRLNQLRLRSNGISHAADAVETDILLGGEHRRTADQHLSTIIALNMDVYAAVALILLLVVAIAVLLTKALVMFCSRRLRFSHAKTD